MKCLNCQSEKGKEEIKEIGNQKIPIWKCLNCNGEHKISLKDQPTEESHATKRADNPPRTTGLAEIPQRVEPEISEHETPERPATGSSSTKSK